MRRSCKKSANLSDHKNMMDLLKQLYGTNEVKDDTKKNDAIGMAGTSVVGGVVEPSSCLKGVFPQDKQ